jgi:hypothetical protein
MKMAMLHRENRLFFFYSFILSLFLISCNKYKQYNSKEIEAIRERTLVPSQNILGLDTYYSIYQMANDSIYNWANHDLAYWRYFGNLTDYQLDSVFCVNEAGNKIFFSLLTRNLHKDGVMDNIQHFYGVKIENQWYFFCGATLVLPREYYQEDIHTPLSFEKLKQIATSNIYRWYLIKGKNEKWVINEQFFDQVTPLSNREIGNKIKTEEEYVRFMVEVNWSSDVNATIKKYQEE